MPALPVTSFAEDVDPALARVAEQKQAWLDVSIDERAELLRDCLPLMTGVAGAWVERACVAKGVAGASAWAGEEWISGPMVTVRYLRQLAEALEAAGRPSPVSIRTGPTGQAVARVFPGNAIDGILYAGLTADLWVRPGQLPTQGRIYRDPGSGSHPGRLALVLGAGNVGSIPPTDLLHKLFVENQVVLLKMNPVNEYLGPLLREAFAPLIDRGFLEIVHGAGEVGDYLCRHEQVDTIHLTGSDRTYEAIVWGADENERARRKAAGEPRVAKPVTAELGCVSPVLVAPGKWTAGEIEFQARNVASMVVHNGSFNCNAAKVLVLPDGWRQRAEFFDAVVEAISRVPERFAYYPGARQRYEAFLDHYPQSRVLSAGQSDVPWTVIPDVPARPGEFALCNEAFCGVLAEVRLDAGRTCDPATFLAGAVRFVNDSVWGTLSCSVLVGSAAERALGDGLEQAVAELRYGGVGINVWPGVLFGLGETSWGAFPGHTPEKIGSGIGAVHNSLLFDHPERSVVRAPARLYPKPPWFADHRNLPELGRQVTRFEAAPSMSGLPGLGFQALLG